MQLTFYNNHFCLIISLKDMKKRIGSTTSLQKSERNLSAVVHLDLKKQKKQENHKHHSRCPLPKPKREATEQQAHLQPADQIKQLKTPILNQLRHLISNMINSSDRIVRLLGSDEPKSCIKIYKEDRQKLLNYLNSLVVRPVDLNQVKARIQSLNKKPSIEVSQYYAKSKDEISTQECIGKEVQAIKKEIEKAIYRKRSKSSFPQLQHHPEHEVSIARNLDQESQKVKGQPNEKDFNSFVKLYRKFNSLSQNHILPSNPESSEHLGSNQLELIRQQLAKEKRNNHQLTIDLTNNKAQINRMKSSLAYAQLLLFKCGQILQQSLIQSIQISNFFSLQKLKADLLVNTLADAASHLRNEKNTKEDVVYKLKEEAQSMILHLSELRKKSVNLIKDQENALKALKQQSERQKDQSQSQDLKRNIQLLNDKVGDLLQEIQIKDALCEDLKQENAKLHDELKNMEGHIQGIQTNYNNLCQEYEILNEKLNNSEALLEKKDEKIQHLIGDLQNKGKDISSKHQQLEIKEEEIFELKRKSILIEESQKKMQQKIELNRIILKESMQNKQKEIQSLKIRIQQLEQQLILLKLHYEKAVSKNQERNIQIANLEQRNQALEKQNEQLYQDITQLEKNQEKIVEGSQTFKELYQQLQKQHAVFRLEIEQNHKKIRFYEEKVIELAQLADTTYYDKIIEQHETVIVNLNKKIQDYEHQINILKNNPRIAEQKIESEPKNDAAQIQQHEEMVKIDTKTQKYEQKGQQRQEDIKKDDPLDAFLLHKEAKISLNSSDHTNNRINLLDVSRNQDFEPAGISALSHYDIIVLNQNLDQIDSHKAVYSKGSSYPNTSNQPKILNTNDKIESDSIKLQPNIEKQAKQETEAKNEQVDKKNSDSVRLQKDHSLVQQDSKKSEIIALCSAKESPIVEQQSKIDTQRNTKRGRSSEKSGNVYIRMKRQSGMSTPKGQKFSRSKSCFGTQL